MSLCASSWFSFRFLSCAAAASFADQESVRVPAMHSASISGKISSFTVAPELCNCGPYRGPILRLGFGLQIVFEVTRGLFLLSPLFVYASALQENSVQPLLA